MVSIAMLRQEILINLTDLMRNSSDINVRLKAAELMGKLYGLFEPIQYDAPTLPIVTYLDNIEITGAL